MGLLLKLGMRSIEPPTLKSRFDKNAGSVFGQGAQRTAPKNAQHSKGERGDSASTKLPGAILNSGAPATLALGC
jgi:hypothetical protein